MQVSSAYKPSVSSRLHDPYAFAVDFEKFIVSLTALFANRIMICSTSAAHVPLVIILYLILQFLLTCSICAILFNTYVHFIRTTFWNNPTAVRVNFHRKLSFFSQMAKKIQFLRPSKSSKILAIVFIVI